MKGMKTGGRKKGTPNKCTTTLRQFICDIVDDNREQFARDLEALEPKERVNIMFKLITFILPKLNSDETAYNDLMNPFGEIRIGFDEAQ